MSIWKQVEELRARGYVIEARPHLGYRLVSVPDVPYPEEILAGLTTEVFGRPAVYLPTTGSTNDEAKRLGREGWPEGTLVAAGEQTGGRGRLGRTWFSPPSGLWFSFLIRPGLPLAVLGPLTILAAVALRRAILARTGIETGIKWPNDLVWRDKKLAGILTEAIGELGAASQVVVGIGVNVNQTETDWPNSLAGRAVSLLMATGRQTSKVALVQTFLGEFEPLYRRGIADGFREAVAEAAANSATLGRRVRLRQGEEVIEGNAVRIDSDGALVVATAAGERRVVAGELEENAH